MMARSVDGISRRLDSVDQPTFGGIYGEHSRPCEFWKGRRCGQMRIDEDV